MPHAKSTHTITTEVEVNFTPASLTETETVYPTLEITFTYQPGSPESGPSYASGGEPADPPEVELVSVRLVDGDGIDPTQAQVDEFAEEWLASDSGFECACATAAEAHQARGEP